MNLLQCDNCGHGGWTVYELEMGVCPLCQEEEEEHDYDFECCDDCEQPNRCEAFGCKL